MAGQRLSLTLSIDGKAKTIADLQDIQAQLEDTVDIPEPPNFGNVLKSLSGVAFAYNNITGAVQNLIGQLSPAYDLLIGSNERLQQGLLESSATIAATSAVFQNGVQITDPTEAIQSLQPQLQKAIADVEKATQSLVGVTSQQTSQVFNTILTNVGQLNDQLQGLDGAQEFTNAIDAASKLAPGLVATLGTLNLPIEQAADEINNLLKGEIDSTAQVAKTLGINREQIENWKAQGTLVAELNKRFEPFVAANSLASKSVSGLTSNIQDIVEVAGRAAGAPLLEILVNQLDTVFQLLNANSDQITDVATESVQVIADLLEGAITAVNEVLAALTPAATAIGTALQDAFGAGGLTAQNTIENIAAAAVQLVEIATPFIQILATLTTGLAQLAATPAGQTLIQVALGAAALNAAIPTLVAGTNSLFKAVNTIETTYNNLLPILSQTNAAKAGLAIQEKALALASGTTALAVQAEAVARARMTVGDTAGAAAALQVAAAEKVKVASIQQSTLAMAGNIAKLGLLAGAVGSVVLAVNQFQEITEESRKTAEGINEIADALAELEEANAATFEATAEGATAAAEAVERNVALIQASLNPVTQFLDRVIGFVNGVINQFNTILQSPLANLIPGVNEVKIALAALGEDGFPQLATGAEAAITQTANSFEDLKVQINEVANNLGLVANAAGEAVLPDLTGQSKQQLDAYVKSLDASLAVLRASRPVNEEDLKYKNENIKLLESAKKQIEKQTDSISIQSKALEDQGTIYETLNKKADNALRTIASSGDREQVGTAAKDLVDLTQQQLELGILSSEQAKQRLTEIAQNGKLEVDVRRSAQQQINEIEAKAVDTSVKEFERREQEIARLEAQGTINSEEAQVRRTANEKEQLAARLEAVRANIEAEQAAIEQGRGSDARLKELKDQEAQLITESAQATAAAEKAVFDQRFAELQRAQQRATDAVQDGETERLTAIQRAVNAGTISQREAEDQRLQVTRERLEGELAAEQQNLARLEALPKLSDPDEEENRQQQIRQSRQQTAQLTLQLLENEFQQQERVRQAELAAIERRRTALQVQAQQQQSATNASLRANQATDSSFQRQVNSLNLISSALDQQQQLLSARQGLQDAINNLAATEARIRIDGLNETLSLQTRLNTEQSAQVKAVLRDRLAELGLQNNARLLEEEIAKRKIEEAEAERQRLAERQQFEQANLQIQQQQEQVQTQLALIEAKRNELAAKREEISARQAVRDAENARQQAQLQLQEAQQVQDPEERERAVAQANIAISQSDDQLASARQGVDLARESLSLASDQVAQAEQAVALQAETARYAERLLSTQQETDRIVANQAASSQIFAANLQLAESSAARISQSLVGSRNVALPQRRMGGDIQPGQIYQVHKDEMFVANTGGYMLRRADALRVAKDSLQSGVSPQIAQTFSTATKADPLLGAISNLQKTIGKMGASGQGITIQNLTQSIQNKVPRNEAAIARMVERANLDLMQELHRKLRGF